MADQHYRVTVGTYDLSRDELHDPVGQQEISIVPVIAGAGNAGKIILGIALVAFSLLLPGVGAAIGGAAMTQIGLLGGALIIGGISGLLAPTPPMPKADQDPRKTYNFSGIQQTSRQGTPVPVIYGKTLVGSIVISAGVDTVQVKA